MRWTVSATAVGVVLLAGLGSAHAKPFALESENGKHRVTVPRIDAEQVRSVYYADALGMYVADGEGEGRETIVERSGRRVKPWPGDEKHYLVRVRFHHLTYGTQPTPKKWAGWDASGNRGDGPDRTVHLGEGVEVGVGWSLCIINPGDSGVHQRLRLFFRLDDQTACHVEVHRYRFDHSAFQNRPRLLAALLARIRINGESIGKDTARHAVKTIHTEDRWE